MKKQCHECKRQLDASSFNGSSNEPDGLAKKCRACVNRRRRQLHAGRTRDRKPLHLGMLVKKGDYVAIKSNRSLINASNRDRLLALAVMDFKSAPKKPSHVEIIKFLIKLGAQTGFSPRLRRDSRAAYRHHERPDRRGRGTKHLYRRRARRCGSAAQAASHGFNAGRQNHER